MEESTGATGIKINKLNKTQPSWFQKVLTVVAKAEDDFCRRRNNEKCSIAYIPIEVLASFKQLDTGKQLPEQNAQETSS